MQGHNPAGGDRQALAITVYVFSFKTLIQHRTKETARPFHCWQG